MRLTVLTDNHTYIDRYYLGEPALCFYLEDGDQKILFDTGYSDTAVKNAEAMGIDLSGLTMIIFSHGHNDHTRGLTYLWETFDLRNTALLAHPLAFAGKRYLGDLIGAPFSKADCEARGIKVMDGSGPVSITDKLTWLGEIPWSTSFEAVEPIGEWNDGSEWRSDYVRDDSALVYDGEDGLFVITGCSHSGICNILMHAKTIAGPDKPIQGIIGGFHLMEENRQLTETIRFLKEAACGMLYPCHCVSLNAKHRMMTELPVAEVGVGLELEIR